MSYGTSGTFTLVPFTNDHTDGTDISIGCNNDHGNVIPGSTKYCCYVQADIGIDHTFYGHKYGNDGGWRAKSGDALWTMRYGTGSRFTHRVIGGTATGWCNNDFFGDPASGHPKHCNYWFSGPSAIPRAESDWTICGNEGQFCKDLETSSAQWVRYGDDNHYFYRLVISKATAKVPCSNTFFDDPIHGTVKYCWRAPPEYKFENVVGRWKSLEPCVGCINTYTWLIGVEEMTEQSMTEQYSESLSTSISSGFSFELADVSTEVSATVATSVATAIHESLKITRQYKKEISCDKDDIFQWTITGRMSNWLSSADLEISSNSLYCLDGPLIPQCPPSLCEKNTDCQTCKEDWAQTEPIRPNLPAAKPEPVEFVDVYEWSLADWYHAHYQALVVCLTSTLVVFCGLNLCVMARTRGAKNKAYAAVKYMETDTEMDAEEKPIKM